MSDTAGEVQTPTITDPQFDSMKSLLRSSDGRPLHTAALAILVLLLMISSGGFLQFLQGNADLNGARTGNWLTNCIWIISYFLAIMSLFVSSSLRSAALKGCWPLFLPVGFTVLSIVWSEDRYLTFLRVFALVGTTILGLYLGERFTFGVQVHLLSRVFGIGAALSLLFGLLLPESGVGTGDLQGDWFGIYPHKNLLGLNMAMGFAIFSLLFRSNPRRRAVFFAWAALCLILVFLSQSATALGCCIGEALVIFVGGPVLRVWRRLTLVKRASILAVAVIFAAFLVSQYEAIPALLDRDPGLTGRTTMWSLVAVMISQKPMLGYGYRAFWRGYEGPSGEIWDAFGSEFFYSHNGFLDVWLDIGSLGLGLLILSYAIAFRRAVALATLDSSGLGSWPLIFLVFLLLSNLTEGSLLRANILPSILYTAIYYRMSAHSQEAPDPVLNLNRVPSVSSRLPQIV